MSNLSQETNKINSNLSVLVAVGLSLLLGACGGGGGASIAPDQTPGLGGASPSSDGNTVSTDTGSGAGAGGASAANISSGDFQVESFNRQLTPAEFTGLDDTGLDLQWGQNGSFYGIGATVGTYCHTFWLRNDGTPSTNCRYVASEKVYTIKPREGLAPTPDEYLPSLTGTVTWNGDYEGEYRHFNSEADEWDAFQQDSGTVEIAVDLDSDRDSPKKEVTVTLSSATGNVFPSADGYTDEVEMIGPTDLTRGGFQVASEGAKGEDGAYSHSPRHVSAIGAWYGALGQSVAGVYRYDIGEELNPDDRIQGAGVFAAEREVPAEQATTTTTTTTTVGDYLQLGVWAENVSRPDALFTWGHSRDSSDGAGFYVDGDLTAITTVTAMTGTVSWDGRYSGNYRTRDLGGNEKADHNDAWNGYQTDAGAVALTVDFGSGFDAEDTDAWTPEVSMTMTSDNDNGGTFPNGESMLSAMQGHVGFAYEDIIEYRTRVLTGDDKIGAGRNHDGERNTKADYYYPVVTGQNTVGWSNQFSGVAGETEGSYDTGGETTFTYRDGRTPNVERRATQQHIYHYGWSAGYEGGFFGPNGEAVGGIYTLDRSMAPSSTGQYATETGAHLPVDVFQGQGTFSAEKPE